MSAQRAGDGEWVAADTVAELLLRFATVRDRFVDDLFATSLREIPELDGLEPRLRQLLRSSIEANVVTFLHVLEHDIDPRTVEAPQSAITYAQRVAQQDIPLTALLRNYRLGIAAFLQLGFRLLADLPGGADPGLMAGFVGRATTFGDVLQELVGVAYEEERERWVHRRGVLLTQRVEALLADPHADVAEAEVALGYQLSQVHLAAVVWTADDGEIDGTLGELSGRLATALRSPAAPLVVPVSEREVWVWVAVRDTDPVSTARLVELLALDGTALRVSVGLPQVGPVGFRDSHRQARLVRAAALDETGPSAMSFLDVGPIAMLAHDRPALGSWVRHVLGALAVDGEREAWLRDTLRVFLAHDGSYAAAAEQLQLHRNTVQYRVQQAEEVRGRCIGADRLQVQLALDAVRWLGPSLLAPDA